MTIREMPEYIKSQKNGAVPYPYGDDFIVSHHVRTLLSEHMHITETHIHEFVRRRRPMTSLLRSADRWRKRIRKLGIVNGTSHPAREEHAEDFARIYLITTMAYDQHLAERISGVLREKRVRFDAKNMMGGLCYMIDDKMAVGIVKDSLMIRIDPDLYEQSLKKKGVRHMDFTAKY